MLNILLHSNISFWSWRKANQIWIFMDYCFFFWIWCNGSVWCNQIGPPGLIFFFSCTSHQKFISTATRTWRDQRTRKVQGRARLTRISRHSLIDPFCGFLARLSLIKPTKIYWKPLSGQTAIRPSHWSWIPCPIRSINWWSRLNINDGNTSGKEVEG